MSSRALPIRIASITVALAALLSNPAPAFARQEFYDALAATGTCADCRLCHSGPVGAKGTWDINKPFLAYMIANSRLGTIPDAAQDSDADGSTDLVELQEFGDPNDPMIGPSQFSCPSGPSAEYGCLTVSAHAPSNGTWQFSALAIAGLLFLRRRR